MCEPECSLMWKIVVCLLSQAYVNGVHIQKKRVWTTGTYPITLLLPGNRKDIVLARQM